jgi:methyl-accepting chemotaxis protein
VAGISKSITSIDSDDDLGDPAETLKPTENSNLDIPKPKKLTPEHAVRPRVGSHGTKWRSDESEMNFDWIKWVVGSGFLIWLVTTIGIAVFVLKIGQNWQSYSALQWAGALTMFIGPALMLCVGAYAFSQLAKITTRTAQMEMMIEQFSQPDILAADKSESLMAIITQHIDFVNAKLSETLGRTAALDEVLKTQATSIDNSNRAAIEASNSIGETLEQQKQALLVISRTFDDRMEALSQMISGHSEELANATRIAEQKIKEARISVEGATSKINSASDIVRSNTVQAASTLSASHDEITSLGDVIRQRSIELDDVYKRHANDLTAMIEHLRDEQQNLGANLEDTLIKMRDLSLSAQASAESLSEASSAGKETVQILAESASLADNAVKTRFAEMEQMVKYSSEHAQNISDLASQRVQNSLEHSRTEIARIERDMAELQTKLSQSNAVATIDLVPDANASDPREYKREKRSRIHLKPLSDERAVVEAANKKNDDTANIPTSEPIDEPDVDLPDEPAISDVLDLHIEEPAFEDLESGSLESDPIIAAIRPVAEYENHKKEKTGFSFRGLFNRNASADENASTDIASTSNSNTNIETPNFVQTLSELGLSPNVIVDDGCVIEAANNRVSGGHEAMSRSVIARLKDPVRHFAHSMSSNSELSTMTIEFASAFDRSVEQLAGDREAIRTRLESEDGRAYLLSDAALNYGRV